MTSKGQITIPAGIRRALRLHAGDKLDFRTRPDGGLEARVVPGRLEDLKGILPKPGKSLSLEEMEAAIDRGGEE